MGILITRHNGTWIIAVREKWCIQDKAMFSEMLDKLVDLKLGFITETSEDCYCCILKDSKIKFEDTKDFTEALDTLLELKRGFGNNFRELDTTTKTKTTTYNIEGNTATSFKFSEL